MNSLREIIDTLKYVRFWGKITITWEDGCPVFVVKEEKIKLNK